MPPYIDLTKATYKYLQISGDLTISNDTNIFVCVCDELLEDRVYFYYKDTYNALSSFYILKDNRTYKTFDEKKIPSSVKYDEEWFIAWNKRSCYGRLQTVGDRFYFSLE